MAGEIFYNLVPLFDLDLDSKLPDESEAKRRLKLDLTYYESSDESSYEAEKMLQLLKKIKLIPHNLLCTEEINYDKMFTMGNDVPVNIICRYVFGTSSFSSISDSRNKNNKRVKKTVLSNYERLVKNKCTIVKKSNKRREYTFPGCSVIFTSEKKALKYLAKK